MSEKNESIAAAIFGMKKLAVTAPASNKEAATEEGKKVTVTVVAHYNTDLVVLPMQDVNFAEIKERVEDVFKFHYFEITMIYFDAENDELYLISEDELQTALAVEEYHTLCEMSDVTRENTLIPQDTAPEPTLKVIIKIDLFFADSPEYKQKTMATANQKFRSLKIENVEDTIAKLDDAIEGVQATMDGIEKGKKNRKKLRKIRKRLENYNQLRERFTNVCDTLNSLLAKNQITQKFPWDRTYGPQNTLASYRAAKMELFKLLKK